MQHMQTAKCFLCWRDEMLDKRRRENLMRRVVARFSHLKVSRSFAPWAALARLQHNRRLREAARTLTTDLHTDLENKMYAQSAESNRALEERLVGMADRMEHDCAHLESTQQATRDLHAELESRVVKQHAERMGQLVRVEAKMAADSADGLGRLGRTLEERFESMARQIEHDCAHLDATKQAAEDLQLQTTRSHVEHDCAHLESTQQATRDLHAELESRVV
jgi:type VI protein secretion system component VasK